MPVRCLSLVTEAVCMSLNCTNDADECPWCTAGSVGHGSRDTDECAWCTAGSVRHGSHDAEQDSCVQASGVECPKDLWAGSFITWVYFCVILTVWLLNSYVRVVKSLWLEVCTSTQALVIVFSCDCQMPNWQSHATLALLHIARKRKLFFLRRGAYLSCPIIVMRNWQTVKLEYRIGITCKPVISSQINVTWAHRGNVIVCVENSTRYPNKKNANNNEYK